MSLGYVWYGTRCRRVLTVALRQLSSNRHRETIPKISRVTGSICFGIMPLYQYLLASCFAFILAVQLTANRSDGAIAKSVVWLSLCKLQLYLSSHLRVLCGCFVPWRELPSVFLFTQSVSWVIKFQEGRNVNIGSSTWKRRFPFFQIPCVFQCIWHYGQLLWSICDDWQNQLRLSLCWFLSQTEP